MRFIEPSISIILLISLFFLSCSSESSPTEPVKSWETIELNKGPNGFIEGVDSDKPIKIMTEWEWEGLNSNLFSQTNINITCEYYNSEGDKISEEDRIWVSSGDYTSSTVEVIRTECHAPSNDEVIKVVYIQHGKYDFTLINEEITQEQYQ